MAAPTDSWLGGHDDSNRLALGELLKQRQDATLEHVARVVQQYPPDERVVVLEHAFEQFNALWRAASPYSNTKAFGLAVRRRFLRVSQR
jgi:hypothetical protein